MTIKQLYFTLEGAPGGPLGGLNLGQLLSNPNFMNMVWCTFTSICYYWHIQCLAYVGYYNDAESCCSIYVSIVTVVNSSQYLI